VVSRDRSWLGQAGLADRAAWVSAGRGEREPQRFWLSVAGALRQMIDDVHELGSSEALRQLELLIMRAPLGLRFVLAARHDLRLGLHRLRLEVAEIRADDLKFTPEGTASFPAVPSPSISVRTPRQGSEP
jgi:LuxR family transcriptional regulator, maltose regulon positive regulatory protein